MSGTDSTPTRYAKLEGSTEEVRLRDLERKGISRVRVLRPADIERMIQSVLAEALVSDARDGEALVQKSRTALLQRMKDAQAQMAAADRAEAEIDRLKSEKAAHANQVREARERLATAGSALRDIEVEAARLEGEATRLAESLAKAESAAADLGRAAPRLERESARLAGRLEKATRSIEAGDALAPRLVDAERRAEAAERRQAALESELRTLSSAGEGAPPPASLGQEA